MPARQVSLLIFPLDFYSLNCVDILMFSFFHIFSNIQFHNSFFFIFKVTRTKKKKRKKMRKENALKTMISLQQDFSLDGPWDDRWWVKRVGEKMMGSR